MQVIGDKQNPVPLLAPAICFICEHSPTQQAGERLIDTERTFMPMGPPTRLNGRKYVCDNCVKEMGRIIGMGFDSETERIRQEFDVYRQGVAVLQQRVQDFANDVIHAGQFVPTTTVEVLTPAPGAPAAGAEDNPTANQSEPGAASGGQEPVAEQKTKEDASAKTEEVK